MDFYLGRYREARRRYLEFVRSFPSADWAWVSALRAAESLEALGDVKAAAAGLSESDLKVPVKMFGRDTTKQGAALMLLFDQHEHLGQSIAYARSNDVAPPWSKPRQ